MESLYRADPVCPLCKRMTFLSKDLAQLFEADINTNTWTEKLPVSCLKRMATLDHLYPRSDYRRRFQKRGPGDVRTRLLCWECNGKRGSTKLEAWPKPGILLEAI